MTVGELKKALDGVADDRIVVVATDSLSYDCSEVSAVRMGAFSEEHKDYLEGQMLFTHDTESFRPESDDGRLGAIVLHVFG